MATIVTRPKNGQEEIIITGINDDLNGLIEVVNEFRIKELQETESLHKKKIFITEDLKFSNQTFDVIFNDIFSDCVFEGKVDFSFASFNSSINFSKTIFKGHTTFSNTTFKSNVDFIKSTFEDIIDFDNATFESDVDFTGSTFRALSFKDTDCQTVVFNKCSFNLILGFDGSVFHNQINFSHSIFNTPQEFKNIHFMDRANFSNTTFEQEAEFKDCKVDSKTLISFQYATFKEGLDISTSNFNLCKLNFLGIKIENINKALSSYIYNYRENDTKPFLSIHQRFRETFRFIKNSLYAENNQIEGLEFHKKEMEVYEKELKLKLRSGRTEKKEGKTNPLWVDIGFAILCILLLVAYFYWGYIFYWGLIVSMLAYFVITITKSNITKESIVKPLSKNPVVYSTVWLLAIAYVFCLFYALYKTPKEFNNIAWIVFISGIFASLLLFSNLTKDNIILFFNKHSNDFGTNWVNGIAFTFLCGIITFILMAIFSNLYFSFSYEGVNNFISSIIKIVNLVDTKPFGVKDSTHLETKNTVSSLFLEMNIPTYITLFIGRIFIGYGYYQTIQAFRKYGK